MQIFAGQSAEWNTIISKLPQPHFLQTWEWAQVKEKYGWKPMPLTWRDVSGNVVAAAMILKRQILSKGFMGRVSILYSPKGPILDWNDAALRDRALNDLQSFAKKQGAIFLKIDPDVVLGHGIPNGDGEVEDANGQAVKSEFRRRGWILSSDQIQFKNTVEIDLTVNEEGMLAQMKQKTRYNIRLAERKEVTVRIGSTQDLPMLYKMYAETSIRDGFVIRDEGYYQTVWNTFMQPAITGQPIAEALIAEVNNEPVAAIVLFMYAGRAYYVYGMSRDSQREKMPAYLLQWEAMKRAKVLGCTAYDLWGAPDEFNESDSMWGVYRFKEGLGGEVVRTLGAYDFASNKLLYKLYADVMPRLLDIMRSRGKEKTKQMTGGA
jgi:peptidoglycan pentaglycine glycine transferase (the first glycine)